VLSSKEIKFSFINEGLNLSKKIDVNIRENLYLIYKEAINNIAKHSNADMVEVKLINRKNSFLMMIKDNGKGLTKDSNKGNGLKNIKMRAGKISGSAEFSNNNGFQIEVRTNPF
jgi:signal transduction histidine kinase